jgi:hypothetical protein
LKAGRSDVGREPRRGPIIIQEFDSTILVPPDFSVSVYEALNVTMNRK